MTTNEPFESADPLVGQILPGGLRVLARVGSTSDGPLYRAQYLQNGPPVALMVLRLPPGPGCYPSAFSPRAPHWQTDAGSNFNGRVRSDIPTSPACSR